ncbi:MAG: hypothetical protein Fur0044_24190 [Anaerolineae bacterium]|nr:hypothetical protein [Anaerolineae bacterium]
MRNSVTSAGSSTSSGGAAPKKKLSRQQIIIYVISIVMILSLAISYLVGNGRGVAAPGPTPTLSAIETPANSSTEEAPPAVTAEPTEAN